jgi:hypothetical protein
VEIERDERGVHVGAADRLQQGLGGQAARADDELAGLAQDAQESLLAFGITQADGQAQRR